MPKLKQAPKLALEEAVTKIRGRWYLDDIFSKALFLLGVFAFGYMIIKLISIMF